VKAHGALYTEVARGTSSCDVLIEVIVAHCEKGITLVLPPGSAAAARARQAGLRVQQEGFADRAYDPKGELVSRNKPGSVYADPVQASVQAIDLVTKGIVIASDGHPITVTGLDTICVHGDSPNAVAMARAVRHALAQAGVAVVAPSAVS
jgi:UPF0271 protein